MIVVGDVKPSLEELNHHGVKGMHWGQHKMNALMPNAQQVGTVAKSTGKAVGNASASTAKVVGKTISYAAQHKRMIAGGVVVAAVLHDIGHYAVQAGKAGIIIKAAHNREAAYKASKITAKILTSEAAKINYAKLIRGAYKITTL